MKITLAQNRIECGFFGQGYYQSRMTSGLKLKKAGIL